MTTQDLYNYPKRGVNRYVVGYVSTLTDLSGKIVLDIPCGDGRASYEFIKRGAEVKALDLFPCFMELKEIKAEYADLTEILPIESSSVDYIICQEGIEHVPNQLKVLEEFNRVLKEDGILLITTPNYSHVRARLSRFFWSQITGKECLQQKLIVYGLRRIIRISCIMATFFYWASSNCKVL